MREILGEWNQRLTESTGVESLRILDFDDTIAYTVEMIEILDNGGNVVHTLSSDEYREHSLSPEEVDLGYHYGFDDFDDVDIDKAIENPKVTNILRSFIGAGDSEKRIIMILTARQQASNEGIRRYLDKI